MRWDNTVRCDAAVLARTTLRGVTYGDHTNLTCAHGDHRGCADRLGTCERDDPACGCQRHAMTPRPRFDTRHDRQHGYECGRPLHFECHTYSRLRRTGKFREIGATRESAIHGPAESTYAAMMSAAGRYRLVRRGLLSTVVGVLVCVVVAAPVFAFVSRRTPWSLCLPRPRQRDI
jgi:hypothetical protein